MTTEELEGRVRVHKIGSGTFRFETDDGLCYRWLTERQREWNFNHSIGLDRVYPYTKAGLLAYVNECIAAEPYDEIIIKDIQR